MWPKIEQCIDQEKNELISWAWPGGYPLVYHCKDGSAVCPKCANKLFHKSQNLSEDDFLLDSDILVCGDIHYEGPDIQCEECFTNIEPAYGV